MKEWSAEFGGSCTAEGSNTIASLHTDIAEPSLHWGASAPTNRIWAWLGVQRQYHRIGKNCLNCIETRLGLDTGIPGC